MLFNHQKNGQRSHKKLQLKVLAVFTTRMFHSSFFASGICYWCFTMHDTLVSDHSCTPSWHLSVWRKVNQFLLFDKKWLSPQNSSLQPINDNPIIPSVSSCMENEKKHLYKEGAPVPPKTKAEDSIKDFKDFKDFRKKRKTHLYKGNACCDRKIKIAFGDLLIAAYIHLKKR